MNKEKISFDEFVAIQAKLEIKIGKVLDAIAVPKSYGLKLAVDFGNGDVRSVFTNLGKTHTPEQFIGLTMPFITNLEPTVIKGVNSTAMIMVGEGTEGQTQVGLDNFGIGTKLL